MVITNNQQLLESLSNKHYIIIKQQIKLSTPVLSALVQKLRKQNEKLYVKQPIDNFFMKVIKLNNLLGFLPILTTGNGNCLYNAISIILNGTEEHFYEIKLGLLFIIFEHEKYFRNVLEKTGSYHSFEKFVEIIATSFSWGDEYCQLGISVLLDRPLNVYSIDPSNNIPYSHEYCVNSETLKKKPINIAFILNHFTALLSNNDNAVAHKPKINQFILRYHLDVFY